MLYSHNIGAFIIRIGFGVYCTIIIVRSPPKLYINYYDGTYINYGLQAFFPLFPETDQTCTSPAA